MIIYKTTNLINGKIYIGQDKNNNPKYLGSGDLIKKAITKYGKDNFKKEIIKTCKNQEELDIFEQKYILEFDTRNKEKGYNISVGGRNGTTLNRKMSEETKEKISKSRTGIKFSDEHKKNLSKSRTGIKYSDETKKRMSDNNPNKGVKKGPLDESVKQKISKSRTGIKHSDETKKRMSEERKGSKNSFYGKTHSEETLSKTKKPIIQLDTCGNIVKEWSGVNEAARGLGIRQSGISLVLTGKYKITNGYKFIYKNE